MIHAIALAFILVSVVPPALARGQSGSQNPTAAPPVPPRLTLPQAEELLRLRNLAVVTRRRQLDANVAARVIAGFKPNPVLTLGAQQFPYATNVPGSAPRFVSTNPDAGANPLYTIHVDKTVERGGKRELRMEQADAIVDGATAQIEDALRVQGFQLRQVFVSAMLARDNLSLASQIQDDYTNTVTIVATRVRAGDLPPVELYRAQAANLPFRQATLDAQNGYEQAIRDVLNVLDAGPDDVAASRPAATYPASDRGVLADRTLSLAVAPQTLAVSTPLEIEGSFSARPVMLSIAELRALALANRPDLRWARSNVKVAQSATRLARAERARDVVVGLEYQRVGSDQAVGVTTQIPLFVYNNQRTGITQATALEQAAEAQVRQAERQALTDVDKAYQAYLAASRTLALYNQGNLKQVEDVRSITAYTYQRGAVRLLELLDAERMARQTLVAFNQARAAYQLALFQLEAATGVRLP
ncbi:MAG: TolC family protein [Cyanobacteria bacterium]|nr:TolC family protein [Cyanobacteriota bacterium]